MDSQEVERLREEIQEYQLLTGRLTFLLTGTANALKGKPDDLQWHDWADLPEFAAYVYTHYAGPGAYRDFCAITGRDR